MMKAALLRTASVPVQPPVRSSSLKISISRHDSATGIFSGERQAAGFPKISLNLEMNHKRISGIRRALSQSDITKSESDVSDRFKKLSETGPRFVPARIPEEADDGNDRVDYAGVWSNDGDKRKIGDYYRELLKSNPTDSLILRNYGRFLDEVEKDADKAEEYYGRAILANPGDGEVLSLYGNLIWIAHRDEERAQVYFDQAVSASPDDCTVLGSYARFMWEVEEDQEGREGISAEAEMSAAMVAAF